MNAIGKNLETIPEGQDISLRGFLYQTDAGEWILSAEPNLRSCCVGSEKKADTQVYLVGNLDRTYLKRAVTVHGQWATTPRPHMREAYIEEGFNLTLLWIIPLAAVVYLICRKRFA